MAVPPIGLGSARSRHISGEVEVEAIVRIELLMLATSGADALFQEPVKEQSLAFMAVPPIELICIFVLLLV
jgi:hypothetical protein